MNNIYSRFTEDDRWLIKQAEWVTAVQQIRETQFALGNGYMGTRGILPIQISGREYAYY